jgi:hypothetical protein
MLHPSFDKDVPFWTPGWQDIMKQMGWRWLLLVPAALLIASIVMLPWRLKFMNVLWLTGGKLPLLMLGGAFGIVGTAIRSIVRTRKDPFCIHCGYSLTGLPDGHNCPECGRPFSLQLIDEYRRDPQWFVKRYRNRGDIPIADAPFDAGPVRRQKSRDGT